MCTWRFQKESVAWEIVEFVGMNENEFCWSGGKKWPPVAKREGRPLVYLQWADKQRTSLDTNEIPPHKNISCMHVWAWKDKCRQRRVFHSTRMKFPTNLFSPPNMHIFSKEFILKFKLFIDVRHCLRHRYACVNLMWMLEVGLHSLVDQLVYDTGCHRFNVW